MKLRIASKIWKRAVASKEHNYTGHQIRRAVLRVVLSCNLTYKRNPRLRWRVVMCPSTRATVDVKSYPTHVTTIEMQHKEVSGELESFLQDLEPLRTER